MADAFPSAARHRVRRRPASTAVHSSASEPVLSAGSSHHHRRESRTAALAKRVEALSGVVSRQSIELTALQGSAVKDAAELADLKARVVQREASKAQEMEVEEEEEEEEEKEDPWDISYVVNVYSYSMAQLLDGSLAGGIFVKAEAVLALSVLMCIQLAFSFGVFDVAMGYLMRDQTYAYMPPVDNSIFYAPSVTASGVPHVNVLLSVAAILLQCTLVSGDSISTLCSANPLERLFFALPQGRGHRQHHGSSHRRHPPRHHRHRRHTRPLAPRPAWRSRPLEAAGDALLVLSLQIFWAIRATLVPALSTLGMALLLANTDNGLDIVLNSLAVGFIVELDDMLYPNLVLGPCRAAYEELEAHGPAKGNPMGSQRTVRHVYFTAAALWCANSLLALFLYLGVVGYDETFLGFSTEDMASHRVETTALAYLFASCMLRALILMAAYMAVAYELHRPTDWAERSRTQRLGFAMRVFVYGVANFGVAQVVFTTVFIGFKYKFGNVGAYTGTYWLVRVCLDGGDIWGFAPAGFEYDERACKNLHDPEVVGFNVHEVLTEYLVTAYDTTYGAVVAGVWRLPSSYFFGAPFVGMNAD